MKTNRLRIAALALALCLALTPALSAAAAAPTPAPAAGGFIDTLLDVPLLGDLLRLFLAPESGDENGDESGQPATAESAATGESARTPESADAGPTPAPEAGEAPAETATPAPETNEEPTPTVTPVPETGETPAPTAAPAVALPTLPWPADWMTGAVHAGERYPRGTEAATMTAVAALWADVPLPSGASLRAASREETNLGDLAADAVAHAAAASAAYQNDAALQGLPLVAMVDGASLSGQVNAGAALDDAAIAAVAADGPLAMVTVTPAKLYQVLTAALEDMLRVDGARFGNYPQVSGLRFVYGTTGGEPQLRQAWLASADSADGQLLAADDTQTKLLLALPAKLLTLYGLDGAAGYTDHLAGQGLTLCGALQALPRNCDPTTLAVLLARYGSVGRSLPDTAAAFDALLFIEDRRPDLAVQVLVDGVPVTAYTNADGNLVIKGLRAGSHTLQTAPDQPCFYLSGVTHLGTSDGTAVILGELPDSCITGQAPATPDPGAAQLPALPTPGAAPAVTAAPESSGGEEETASAAPTAAPAPEAAAPSVQAGTAAGTSSGGKGSQGGAGSTAAPSATPAPVDDPTAGTLLGATPKPTREPTPTPAPTPAPTEDPEQAARRTQAEQASGRLPLYIGVGLLAACGLIVGGAAVKRKRGERKKQTPGSGQ